MIFYLSFVGKEELVTHLDKLKQIYEPKSKEYKKELMNQPKFVINLEKELNKHLPQDKVDQILEGKENIKQNSSPKKKSCYICQVMQKMETELDEKTMQEILASGLHKRALGSSSVAIKYKKLYQKLGDIDLLLEQMHDDWVVYMSKTFGEHKEAMEFIQNNPLYGYWGGERKGNKLYKTKFPFKIIEHLEATDDIDRRYNYCHCGWVKETIRNDDLEINGDFCYCGAGWSKQLWDTILGVSLETELLETVLNKDERCLFVFTLPDEVVK